MKLSLVEVLVCPACRGRLSLDDRIRDGVEVLEGVLRCATCAASYPVSGGVPRFVAGSGYASTFGYEWTRFRRVQIDSCNGTGESGRYFHATTGWTASECAGRTVLDAGVGAGRYAEIAASLGAEVFGIDVTEAVDAAYANVGRRDRVHIIQADIFALPFRNATFDLAYSIGVLHHTPDPRTAFRRVAATVRPGGRVAVYVYPHPGLARLGPDLIRSVTTRLPLPLVLGLSSLAVPLSIPYRIPLVGKVLQALCPISLHPDPRTRWLDTFDWYTPKYQWKLTHPEVFGWFKECGFRDVEIHGDPIRMAAVKNEARPAASGSMAAAR